MIVLTKYPISSDIKCKPGLAVRWYQVDDWLEKELWSYKIKPLSKFFIEQFQGFLIKQNMIVKKVSSPISKSLQLYQKKVGDLAKALSNMHSIKRLDDKKELRPVRDLMLLMGDAVASMKDIHTIRFLSGRHKGGWIGVSLNKMDYFFCISYNNP